MSYKLRVLKDHPIGFWPLDELYTSVYTVLSYNDSSEFYDVPGFYNSTSSYSDVPIDISGCGNNGTYNGDFPLNDNIMPLVMGGVYGTIVRNTGSISCPVNKNYYGSVVPGGGFGNSTSSDNDFSLEIWLYPSITTSNRTTIFADTVNGIGLFYEKNNVVFKLNSEELYYHINSQTKVFHIVATYSQSRMSLYIDGYIVATKELNSFRFSNSTTGNFNIGPTQDIQDYIIVDAPAIYRYALDAKKINLHYLNGIYHVNPLQIVNVDQGILFSTHEENLKKIYVYDYGSEQFRRSLTEDVYYNENDGYVGFYQSTGAKSLVILDSIMLPSALNIVSSKIEWRGDNSVTVEMGTDGITYPYTLTNGSYLPLYNKEGSITNGVIYFRITFSTADSSKYFPKFSKFTVKFYDSKDLYSENSGQYITSTGEYSLSSFSYPPLLRIKNDGLQTSGTSGFKINADIQVNTLEFFYTPSALTASTLINSSSANLSWNGSGILSKTNISAIYINGIDKSSATNISSLFTQGQIHHVSIKFTSSITGDIKFNYNTSGGPSNKFNNIAIYNKSLTPTEILRHYSEYIGRTAITVVEEAIEVTEGSINYADSEWVVISSN